MKKKLIIFFILALGVSLYLNRSYARIYDRNEINITQINWPQQISFPNPNFQNNIKYVALGDSLTNGVGSDNINNTLVFIFAQKLSQNMSVSLINLAVNGVTTDDLIKFQLNKAIEKKPNYVTLFIGINDIHNHISVKKFQQNMDLILNRLTRETEGRIIVFNLPYLGSGNLILPPFNIFFDYKTKQFNQVISRIVSEKNITLVDIYTPTKETFSKKSSFYSSDEFHPSKDGYIFWGSLLQGIQ